MVKQQQNTEPDWHGLLLVAVGGTWMAGIILDSWMPVPSFLLLAIAALVAGAVFVFWSQPARRYLLLLALCVLLGAWRYATVSPVGDPEAINTFIGSNNLEVQGTVADEPKLEPHSTLLVVSVSSVSTNAGTSWHPTHGQIEVQILGSIFDDPYAVHYGDSVSLQGRLFAPRPQSLPSILASMAFPNLQISSQAGFSPIGWLYQMRTRLAGIILQALPQPFAALLIALLLSLHTPALKPLIPVFNATGTAHLIAPSGFKVTQVAGLIRSSTRRLYEREKRQERYLLPAQKRRGNWKRWLATTPVILGIAVYTFLSGGGPAALRAGIMGSLLVLAPRLGRIYNVYNALALTALLMSLLDPFVLWDVGFQLSFLGTLGIVLLTPLLMRPLHFLERLPGGHVCAENIAVTLAAEVATLPIQILAFGLISFIAPVTNVLTVPLLGILLGAGILVCGAGLLSLQLSILCGWIALLVLQYVNAVISWCAGLPGAYQSVNNLSAGWAWGYYELLALIAGLFLRRWPHTEAPDHAYPTTRFLSRRNQFLLKIGAALLIVLATGTATLAARSDGQLSILFLQNGQANVGGAMLISTPDGKTALINEGADVSSLAQMLDNQLSPWRHMLDMLILTAPAANNLTGLQDVITRYQVGEIVDAGMLHPSTAYARWRHSIAEHKLLYTQVRQGAAIELGRWVNLQVLWPVSPLHKGSNETKDNALILRLVAPGLRMLLLDTAASSAYALKGLPGSIDPGYLQADVVQVTGERSRAFPKELSEILEMAHPSLLVVTAMPASPKQRKAGETGLPILAGTTTATYQIMQVAQVNELKISSNGRNLSITDNSQEGA